MKNPIKDNRIVIDLTFATRLYKFLSAIYNGEMVSKGELVKLRFDAGVLLNYQRFTCTEQKEKDYFDAIGEPLKEVEFREVCDISELVGKTLVSVRGLEEGSGEAVFTCSDGTRYVMYHDQECCEVVEIDDVCGDVDDLVGCTVLKAEEVSNADGDKPGEYGSATWTFYHIHTVKGTVTVKWYGTSNGYYSEYASFAKVHKGYR